MKTQTILCVFYTAVLSVYTQTSVAETDTEIIPEIVVTADFREQELRLVAGSVSVLSEETIGKRNGQHIEQILNMAPNVNYAAGASRGRFFQIRGVGERSQFKDPLDTSVGLIVDGVDFSGIGLVGTLYDVRQIEVLRGPQGTTFGSNALGGLVFVESNGPTEEFESSITTGIGDYGMWQAGAVLSGPLADGLQARLAVHQYRGDGYIENDFLGRDDTNGYDELTIRGKLRWESSPNTTVNLTGLYVDADNGYDGFSLENTRHTGSDEPGHDRQESNAVSLNIVHEWADDFQIQANASWEHSDLEYGFDWDWSYVALGGVRGGENNARDRDSVDIDIRLISKESARIAGIADWVVGAYRYTRDVALDHSDRWEDDWGFFPSTFSSNFETVRTAVYGQLDWPLSDRVFLSIGGRLESYDHSYRDTAAVSADPDDDQWGGRASLEYLVSDDLMLYGSITRGYKTGGINGEAVAGADPVADPVIADFLLQRLAFDAETLVNYEIGMRGSFLNQSLDLSVSAFLMERDDMQAKAWILFEPADWKSYMDNVDEGENLGLEFDLAWRASERLGLAAGLGLLDTELGELTVQHSDTGLPQSQQGRDQAHAPGYQYYLSVNYDINSRNFINAQLEGKDEYFFSNSHNIQSDSHRLVHLTTGYTGDQFEVSIWGRNLLDEDYQVRGFYFGNNPLKGWVKESYYQIGEPRTLGVTVRYSL